MTELIEEYLKHINGEDAVLVDKETSSSSVRCNFISTNQTGRDRGPFRVDITTWELLAFVNEKTTMIINELTKNTP